MLRLSDLKDTPDVAETLDRVYDFDLKRASVPRPWIKLQPPVDVVGLAGDAAGGVFLAYGEGAPHTRPVLYATSEGHAGKIAQTLEEAIALQMQMPHWRDVLHFSAGGDLTQMRRAAPFLEAELLEEAPEIPEAKARLADVLDVPVLDDPVESLHHCVQSTDVTLVRDDGTAWGPLFNSFTIDQNPGWQQWAARQGG